MNNAPWTGRPVTAASSSNRSPSTRAPVPQSRTTNVPLDERTSMHDVLPPYRTVPGPGVAIEPRVPQNVTLIAPPRRRVGPIDIYTSCRNPRGRSLLEKRRHSLAALVRAEVTARELEHLGE